MQGFVHVVDDDASFRKAIERQLKQAGYDVATYASAEHLLDCLPSENIPSCILLDVQYTGTERTGAASALSELGSTLPIIFLTGYPGRSNHGADHQGGCGGLSDQTGTVE
jgi:FixJ family two-component response regulator